MKAQQAAAAAMVLLSVLAGAAPSAQDGPSLGAWRHDGRHDFDFDVGVWQTHSTRLLHPLTGSTVWAAMDGTTTVLPLWDGRGNLAVLEADGPAGRIELLSLRLYNASARQWSLNFATSRVGTTGTPLVGAFCDGVGAFYDQEPYQGRMIWVRFTMRATGPGSARSEQAFSADGGRTWEVNWINIYSRQKGN